MGVRDGGTCGHQSLCGTTKAGNAWQENQPQEATWETHRDAWAGATEKLRENQPTLGLPGQNSHKPSNRKSEKNY